VVRVIRGLSDVPISISGPLRRLRFSPYFKAFQAYSSRFNEPPPISRTPESRRRKVITMSSNYAKRYSNDFKEEAVRLLMTSGKNAAQLGRELGVSAHSAPGSYEGHLPFLSWQSQGLSSTIGG
jgi:hypothetical protein